jgi:four helix bundle protein
MENILKSKSFAFSERILKLVKYLQDDFSEYGLSKQLLKSGTSIGTNIRESEYAESKNDFIHKLAIAQKECNETIYWLELLKATDYLSENQFDSIHQESIELIKLLTSSIKTTKSIMNN